MRFLVRPGLGVLVALSLAGCQGEPLAPGPLTLRLDVQPRVVSPADSFTVHLVIRNNGWTDTTLTSGCGLPAWFALDGPAGIVYPSPWQGCFAMVTPIRIAGRDSLTMTRRFIAAQPPGEYVVFTDWLIAGLPVLQRPLTIQ